MAFVAQPHPIFGNAPRDRVAHHPAFYAYERTPLAAHDLAQQAVFAQAATHGGGQSHGGVKGPRSGLDA